MPCIKPVSDLRNYNEVLQDVVEDSPVFLTKNGRGAYAIVTINEYEKMDATVKMFSKLNEGEESAQKDGFVNSKDVRKILGV